MSTDSDVGGARPRTATNRPSGSAAVNKYQAITDVAIIGLGPWGVAVLERLVTAAKRRTSADLRVRAHVVDPGVPGVGAFALDDPDYLILNTPCGWHCVAPFPDELPARSRHCTLFEWARGKGYRWVGDECRIGSEGVPITRDDFLPRRLMGEYLAWSLDVLVDEAPPNLDVVRHATSAVDIVRAADGRERLVLADGSSFAADDVIVTTGHTPERAAGADVATLPAYPVSRHADADGVPPDANVAITGMGLVALDIVTALTVGRGGAFVEHEGRLRYIASGREPNISMFSRSGYPYCAKSSQGSPDPSAATYEPAIYTDARVAALHEVAAGQPDGRRLDARTDLLPLLFAEMQLRFYTESTRLRSGPTAAKKTRDRLAAAWARGDFTTAVAEYAALYGDFDAEAHFFVGANTEYLSGKDYEEKVYHVVQADLAEALATNPKSAIKAAYSVPRVLRDSLRALTEFGRLTPASYRDFQTVVRPRIARLIAGPPTARIRQLLALLDAGIVRLPFGPAPVVEKADDGGAVISSRNLVEPNAEPIDYLIQGSLGEPTLRRTCSPLLRSLRDRGRLRELAWDGIPAGSVALSEDFHPIDVAGTTQCSLSIFGSLTEGVRYYTAYVPSPKDRRASLDAARCIEQVIARARDRRKEATPWQYASDS